MPFIRRFATPLAVLLALVVAGEVTDLVPCGDSECGVWSVVLGTGAPADGGGPAGGPDAACLCHAHFVATGAAPGVPVPADCAAGPCPAVAAGPSAGAADVPHPPPLG